MKDGRYSPLSLMYYFSLHIKLVNKFKIDFNGSLKICNSCVFLKDVSKYKYQSTYV